MAYKVDVEVTVSPAVEAQARGLRVGGTVHLARCSDGSLACSAHPSPSAPAQTPAESSTGSQQQRSANDATTAQQPASVSTPATDLPEDASPAAFGTIGAEAGVTLPPGAVTGTVRSIRCAVEASTRTPGAVSRTQNAAARLGSSEKSWLGP